MRSNVIRLHKAGFRLDTGRKFLLMRVVRHWNEESREVVEYGSVQSQIGWGLKQPGLVEGALAHGREI